jgi:membrane-bound ClpP family serine protease
MEILLNPNIAYLILAFGLMITVLAILSPGTGLLEIAAVLVLMMIGWLVYNLSFNAWALLLLLIGIVFFVIAVRQPRQPIYLIVSIITLVVGSAYLFPGDEWWRPAVNPALAILVSVGLVGYFWIIYHKIMEARQRPPRMDLNSLIGMQGEAKTYLDNKKEGTVLIGSELWSARGLEPISLGARVRVVKRDGFILEVEKVPTENN